MQTLSQESFFSALAEKARGRRIPEHVILELSYGCNLRCVHCLNPTHQRTPRELTAGEIRRILEQSTALGSLELTLTGGEPLAHPDFFMFLEMATALGFVVNVLSNATLITRNLAERLCAFKLKVDISIYGTSKQTYEQVTQRPGSFERFVAGIGHLASCGVRTNMRMPVMTVNQHELEEARNWARRYGFGFQYCLEIHPRQDHDLSPLAYRLTPEDKLAILKQNSEELSPSCNGEAQEQIFFDCECGQSQFAVTPYGEMNLCTSFPFPKYDLKRGSVQEGWEVLKKTVDEATPSSFYECPRCEVKSFCRQGRNDAWLEKREMSHCLPYFKELATAEKQMYGSAHP